MKSICLFCGKNHKTARPLKCKFKGAVATSLIGSFTPKERYIGMLIVDKTEFLELAWLRFRKGMK